MASFDFSIHMKSKDKSKASSKIPADTASSSSSSAESENKSTSTNDKNELPESNVGGQESQPKSTDNELPESNVGGQESQPKSIDNGKKSVGSSCLILLLCGNLHLLLAKKNLTKLRLPKGFLKKFLLKNSEFKCSYKGEDLGWDIAITKGSNLAVEKKASASASSSTSTEVNILIVIIYIQVTLKSLVYTNLVEVS
ncbi:hypothetical protein C5167_002422 [Papaver somniferum]|uniref:Uncharacterized protein n=1 Tax=Papaver somniferum TaxID=3469 RepID=A0A4Y7L1X1_PAPSO|nr:hypothetical protein C5167_002422 [Papaver somniferum]